MKKGLLFIIVCISTFGIYAQGDMPRIVSPEDIKRFNAEIEKQIPALKKRLTKDGFTDTQIEFAVDTFKIEQLLNRKLEVDYSTAGMNRAMDDRTEQYDKLMNKYYNRVMKYLSEKDKKVLIATQRNWVNFRDSEQKLIYTLTKDEYSGGGSIQSNIAVANYARLIEQRTLQIFEYFQAMYIP